MKAVKNKFVVCMRDENGQAELRFFSVDRRGNRTPQLFDFPAEAVIEIGRYFMSIGEAEIKGDVDSESLNEPFGLFIARYDMNSKGEVLIETLNGEEVIYEGTYNSFIISIN